MSTDTPTNERRYACPAGNWRTGLVPQSRLSTEALLDSPASVLHPSHHRVVRSDRELQLDDQRILLSRVGTQLW